MKLLRKIAFLILAQVWFVAADAQVVVTDAWARPSGASDKASPVYMNLLSPKDSKLISVRSSFAETVEVHSSAQGKEGKAMHPLAELQLHAGKPLEFKPDGYHLMLTDLKKPIRAGFEVQITLIFQDADGTRDVVYVHAPVSLTKPK